MPATGFHSDWISLKNHRILLESRAGFPTDKERFIASVCVELINNNASNSARVVSIYYDDKSCSHTVTVASTNKDDERVEDILTEVLHNIYGDGNCQVSVIIFEKGDEHSDHYNHMEYLSVSTDTAVDRWKDSDDKYQEDVYSPR